MIKFITSKVLGFLPLKSWVIGLVLALSASTAIAGKLLFNANIKLSESQTLIEAEKATSQQWKVANDLSIKAYQELDRVMLLRSQENVELALANENLQNELKVIKDETGCMDMPHPDDVSMLLNTSRKASSS